MNRLLPLAPDGCVYRQEGGLWLVSSGFGEPWRILAAVVARRLTPMVDVEVVAELTRAKDAHNDRMHSWLERQAIRRAM